MQWCHPRCQRTTQAGARGCTCLRFWGVVGIFNDVWADRGLGNKKEEECILTIPSSMARVVYAPPIRNGSGGYGAFLPIVDISTLYFVFYLRFCCIFWFFFHDGAMATESSPNLFIFSWWRIYAFGCWDVRLMYWAFGYSMGIQSFPTSMANMGIWLRFPFEISNSIVYTTTWTSEAVPSWAVGGWWSSGNSFAYWQISFRTISYLHFIYCKWACYCFPIFGNVKRNV